MKIYKIRLLNNDIVYVGAKDTTDLAKEYNMEITIEEEFNIDFTHSFITSFLKSAYK